MIGVTKCCNRRTGQFACSAMNNLSNAAIRPAIYPTAKQGPRSKSPHSASCFSTLLRTSVNLKGGAATDIVICGSQSEMDRKMIMNCE
jgi:hypothetical protein